MCYLLEGSAHVEVGGESFEMKPGEACFFPAGITHVFTVTSERVKVLAQPVVAHHARRPVGVHRDIVPGGHARVGGVPAGRDIGVRPLKDGERGRPRAEEPRVRIGAGDVADQEAIMRAATGQKVADA